MASTTEPFYGPPHWTPMPDVYRALLLEPVAFYEDQSPTHRMRPRKLPEGMDLAILSAHERTIGGMRLLALRLETGQELTCPAVAVRILKTKGQRQREQKTAAHQ